MEKQIKEEELNFLKEIICCPYCSGVLEVNNEKIICKNCKKIYKIKDGIIVLL
ncbi:MAG: Trm112 family protein [Nanoarchaeota archaeon]